MKCYQATWNYFLDYPVFGFHRHELPIPDRCPNCDNSYGIPSVGYPWIDGAKIFPAKECKLTPDRRDRIAWETYHNYAVKLRSALGDDYKAYPVVPAMHFGEYECKIRSEPPPLSLSNTYTLIAWKAIAEEIRNAGFVIKTCAIVVTGKRNSKNPLVEIWVPAVAEMKHRARNLECESCGRAEYVCDGPIDLKSVPPKCGIFQLRRHGSQPMFTECLWSVLQRYSNKYLSVKSLDIV